MPSLFITTALVALGSFVVLWLVSIVVRDASIVDPVWGASFALVTWVALFRAGDPGSRQILVATLVTIWGTRLVVHLTVRKLGQPEDYCYRAMRRRWGHQFSLVSLGTVFVLQASLMWVVSLPAQVAMLSPDNLGPLSFVGLFVCSVGLFYEAVGD